MKLVIATKNSNKIREIRARFSSLPDLDLLSLLDYGPAPDIIEDGNTFEENAVKKALGIMEFTGLPSMADDSGLVVDALGGEPGVYSSRYAGMEASDNDRNLLVLRNMRGVPDDKRTARFVCVIAVAFDAENVITAEGTCEGTILKQPRGANGFGYDPIFYLPERGKSMAELTLEEKNMVSHRAAALALTENKLRALL